jgi:sugar transferase (PEP-CTERM/EpsH1 system associated)
MRILWLKSDLLLPLDKGGKLRTWHLLRHLAARHEITYVSFADPDRTPADLHGMREVASRVVTIPRTDPAKGSLGFYLDAARYLLHPLPYAVGKYRSRRFASTVARLIARGPFDLIVSDFLFPAINLPPRLPCPAVIFTHNVESEIWRRYAETHRGWRRWLYDSQYRRMLRYEGRALRRFDGVLAVSAADRGTLARLYPTALRSPVHVVPTGVDTTYFAPPARRPLHQDASQPARIVFTGSMDWLPNEDAMLFFCREVLPLVQRAVPDAQISIVGRTPTPAVKALAKEKGVTVTGRVDDVRPYLREAAVYVVPLRIGGGTRLKIFEAMAMGRAVVSTSVGAEGLPVTNGEHLLVADGPRELAKALIGLIRDMTRRRELGDAARALVVDRYDWAAVADDLERALVRFASATAQDAPVFRTPPIVESGFSRTWDQI